MAIITLTSDLGSKDHYVAVIKAAIFAELPEVKIVDISHEISPFDIQEAAYILKNSYPYFPAGSVHIIGMNDEKTPNSRHLAIYCDGHYFIGADNGIFSLVFDKNPEKIIELDLRVNSVFPTRDIFAKAACHIARGGTLEMLGKPIETVTQRLILRPVSTPTTIRGSVIYIDYFGNVIYNIKESLFKEVGKGRPFQIFFKNQSFDTLSKKYSDVSEGELLALFNASGFLEIAQNKGRISRLEGIHINDPITIEFHD
jgi:S-adenosyl-L-methionine hydrolase (adenosine-forming)